MAQFLSFLIIGLVGVAAGYFLALRKGARGDGGLIARQQAEKKENKRKIREFMQGKDTITNNEVEKLLGVSDSTATRYLDELENEKVLEQVGKTGRSVLYRPIH